MTPLEISLVLHYHCTPGPHPQAHAPAVREAIERFMREDILEYDPEHARAYKVAERGRALVEMLCATPLPVVRWCDPRADRTEIFQ